MIDQNIVYILWRNKVHKINFNINTRAWTLSVQDDFGNWNEVDVADHKVSDIINEYILDLEESF